MLREAIQIKMYPIATEKMATPFNQFGMQYCDENSQTLIYIYSFIHLYLYIHKHLYIFFFK